MIGIATSGARTDLTIDGVKIRTFDDPGLSLEVGNSKIQNMKIATNTDGIVSTGTGIFETLISGVDFDSLDTGNAITITGAQHVTISDCFADGFVFGILINDTMDSCTISGNVLKDCTTGIKHLRTTGNMTGNKIVDNIIDTPFGDALVLDHSAGGTPGWNRVDGNLITGGAGRGIYTQNHTGLAINDNTVESVSGLGLEMVWSGSFGNPDNIHVTGNSFTNTDGALIDGTGISGFLYGLLLDGNTFDNSDLGIEIRDLIFAAKVSNNILRETLLKLEDADGSVISDNRMVSMTVTPNPFAPDVGHIIVDTCDDVTITGNVLDGENSIGTQAFIELAGTMTRTNVALNVYAGQDPASGSGGVFEEGIRIGANASLVTLHGNDFSQATTPVVDNGPSTTDLHTDLVGLWQTWTPTYTNLTIGNGTVVARFTQIGKTVHVHFTFTLGSTSAIGTNPYITVPVTASAQYANNRSNIGGSYFLDTGTIELFGITRIRTTTTINGLVSVTSGTYGSFTVLSATVPFTWTTGDIFHFSGTYEAA